MIPASDALAWGMVGEVTQSDEVFGERFLEYGRMLASVAPIAARQTKRLVGGIARPPDLQAHLTEEIRLTLQAFTTEDSKEAVRRWRHGSTRRSPVVDASARRDDGEPGVGRTA